MDCDLAEGGAVTSLDKAGSAATLCYAEAAHEITTAPSQPTSHLARSVLPTTGKSSRPSGDRPAIGAARGSDRVEHRRIPEVRGFSVS
jgi:hypothetical protein